MTNETDQRAKGNPELFILNKTVLETALRQHIIWFRGMFDAHFSQEQ